MAFELKEGQGSLFKNDKGGNYARPDYTGTMMVGGKIKRLAAWVKDGKKDKFLSLMLSEQKQKRETLPEVQVNIEPPVSGAYSDGAPVHTDQDLPF